MWSRTLSPSEVASIYSSQSAVGGTAITGNGNSFSITGLTTTLQIISAGATITIANSTVATVNVTGADATGDGQDGGTINLTNSTAGALIANGGNSTDNGQGGAAGSFNLTSSTATSQTANSGNCGPNTVGCSVSFTDNGSGDWDDTANWSNGIVPDSSTNVVINSSVTNISSGNAYAKNVTFTDGIVWDPYYSYLTLNSSGTTTFNGSSYFNYGEIYGNTVFKDSSFANAGYIHGNAEFHGSSYSSAWQIDGDATFYDSSYFYCSYAGGNVVLNDSSYLGDCGPSAGGTLTINSTWYSGTAPTNGILVIDGNYGGYWGGNFSNTIYGSDSQPIDTFQFENGAYNNASIYVTNSIFNSGSYNNSYISQNATFNSDSLNNYGEVDGTATFNDTSISYNGNLYGQAIFNGDTSELLYGYLSSNPIRYYNSPVTTSRDFTSDGNSWIITADAVVVDLSGATCNANTTFLPVNGGSFIYGPNCLSGPPGVSIIAPTDNATISSAWLPQVNWNQGAGGYNYTSCQYSFGLTSDWNGTDDWASGPSVGSWSGASCTGNGSDILAPTNRGTQLFVIRAFYNGTATTSIRTINYIPSRQVYFYNSGSNANWSTVGNWYTDQSHTVSAGSLPTQIDKVTVLSPVVPTVDIDTWIQPSLINSGAVGIVFNSSANASTTVTINGKAQYTGSAKNKGTVNGIATFNETSANIGTVKSFAIFNASSINSATVQGGATFNGDSAGNTGTVLGIKTRYYNATTTTTRNFTGWTVVADGVTVNVASSTHDSSTIFRTVNRGSFIGGPATVYWFSNGADTNWTTIGNWYATGTTTPLGRVASSTEIVVILGTSTPHIDLLTWTEPSGVDASLTGLIISASTTAHISTGITGNTILMGVVINDSVISGNVSLFNTSKNSLTGTIVGTADFYGTTQNNGTISGDANFHNFSLNSAGGSITGDVVFSDSSYNNTTAGSIGGTATFNNSAHNDGNIDFNAVFGNNITENNGTVGGIQTRYFTVATTTSRDFVTTGPWTVVADGVIVNVASSSVFSTSTTFTTVSGGSFVGEGLPGATTCAKPLIFPGTYTLSTTTANTCDIQSNGVTLNGGGHQLGVGSLPQAFPDNASNSGWIDMTGNWLLYHLNETSFSSIIDSSGRSGNASVHGTLSSNASGVIGNSLVFNGSSYLNFVPPPLNTSTSFSISLWAKPTTLTSGSDHEIFTTGNNGGGNTIIRIYYEGRNGVPCAGHLDFAFDVAFSSNEVDICGDLTTNEWQLITGVYDANTHILSLYKNGSFVAANTISFTSNLVVGNGTIGVYWNGPSGYYDGAVDEVALWTRALSLSEVANIYSQQSGGFDGGNISANGYGFSLTNATVLGTITSAGATISIANSTVATVNVTGADAVGDAQAGGTINLTSSSAGALVANGGNSTDFGFGGAAGVITLDGNSTATSQTANSGSDGPNKGSGQQNTGGSSGGNVSPVPGCTDPSASNYSSHATVDNGSCRYSVQIVRGCTDPGATNYNQYATVNNGSCSYASYNPYVAPTGGNTGGGGGGDNSAPTFNGVNIQVGSTGGTLALKPLPEFAFGVNGTGDTVLGNPLAGLKALGALDLKALKFSFTLPLSDFLFAPLPKSITDALLKAPKLSNTIASVGISRAQDLVKLQNQPILLPQSDNDTPGLFVVTKGTTTLDTFVSRDATHDLIELVNVQTGDVLNVSLVPLSKGKAIGMFDGIAFTFIPTPKTVIYTVITASSTPGKYLLTTASAPLPLVINVTAPPPPRQPEKPLHWWQKVVKWIRGT